MSRDLHANMEAVTTNTVVRPFFLVSLIFDTNPLRLWTGVGDLIYNGVTFLGVGDLLNISSFEEKSDLSSVGATITLNGLKTSLVQIARDEDYQGRAATIALGAFDSTGSIISNPVTMFSGFMDVMTINEGAEFSEIILTLENKLLQLERTKERRYTDEDQKIDFPNDKGFEFVSSLQDKEVVWGRAS